jgi:hypothetical protein
VSQRGTSEEERSLLVQQLGINGSHGTARLSIENEHSTRSQTPETLAECGVSHGVVHDIHPGTAGQPSRLALEILLGIEDDFMRPCCARHCRLRLGRYRPEHTGSPVTGDLAEQLPHSTGSSVDQTGVR